MRRIIWILIVALFLILLWLAGIPHFAHFGPRSGPGPRVGIYVRLRWIDGAKQQWAIDHGITNGSVVPSTKDLEPYMRRIESVASETYTINALNRSPEAQLTREWQSLPGGTILRFGTNGAEELVMPSTR